MRCTRIDFAWLKIKQLQVLDGAKISPRSLLSAPGRYHRPLLNWTKQETRDMRLRFAGNAVAQTGRDNDLIPARCVQESKRRHNRRWQTFGDLTTFSLLVTRICDWMSSDRNPKPMQCQTLPTTGWRARCSGRIPVGLLEDCRCLDELPCRRGVLSLSCRGRLHGVDS